MPFLNAVCINICFNKSANYNLKNPQVPEMEISTVSSMTTALSVSLSSWSEHGGDIGYNKNSIVLIRVLERDSYMLKNEYVFFLITNSHTIEMSID